MKEKLTDNIEDYDEDIPSRENCWKRYKVDTIKRMFSDWIDDNIKHEYKSHPECLIKDGEKRFYMRIIEEVATDKDPEDNGYYCLVVPFDTKQVEEV